MFHCRASFPVTNCPIIIFTTDVAAPACLAVATLRRRMPGVNTAVATTYVNSILILLVSIVTLAKFNAVLEFSDADKISRSFL